MSGKESFSSDENMQFKKKRHPLMRAFLFVFQTFYYALMTFLVVAIVFLMNTRDGNTHVIFGYSVFTVLTGSMHPEIPQGSFIIVKEVEPDTITVGDNITFIQQDKRIVTHQVVDVYENHQESGLKAFQTKGVNNPSPDREAVYADNLIGKVLFHNLDLGQIFAWLKSRIWLLIALFVVFVALMTVFRRMRVNNDGQEEPLRMKAAKGRRYNDN